MKPETMHEVDEVAFAKCEARTVTSVGESTEISGHLFKEAEVIHNCTVKVMRCEECGHVLIGWQKGEA